ncbi:MAG: YlxM family DNA-binding protein [Lachnospiraceae bacterium]|nr:YlxM family DNA-binding protein [Lachnospiraceae bacterium]
MERIVKQNLLYDFYGELLTEHQKRIYEDAIFDDLSLSEIAESYGITRQGAHDVIRRVDKMLENYESKLHLVERFGTLREYAEELKQVLSVCSACQETDDAEKKQNALQEALALTERIIDGI